MFSSFSSFFSFSSFSSFSSSSSSSSSFSFLTLSRVQYFTTARFLDALDWHAENVALGKLGVGMMNRVVGSPGGGITQNGWAARFHAIKASKVTQLDIFLLPIDDELLQWLWRWKTKEKHCPNGGVLSAFEPAANCLPPSARH